VFLFLIPGMIAFALTKKPDSAIGAQLAAALLPDSATGALQNPDLAFPMLVNTLLPVGLKGVVICGILAALMSSLASLYNSSAMLYTIDIYKRRHPQTEEKKLVKIGRMATVFVVVLGVLWIFVIQAMGKSLYDYIQSIQSLLAPAIAAVFLLGICWKRTTPKAGMWTLITGLVLGFTRLFVMILNPESHNWFTYIFNELNVYAYGVWMFLFCMVVAVVTSLFTPKPAEEQVRGLCFGTATPEQKAVTRASWNTWDIIHTVIILSVTVAFYIYFW
ncbi:MAG: Na+/glucose cotransporter, partial [Bacteroidales bacterium]|nr:Na+/glucose cotransporter [Bacteroidales bacterium]